MKKTLKFSSIFFLLVLLNIFYGNASKYEVSMKNQYNKEEKPESLSMPKKLISFRHKMKERTVDLDLDKHNAIKIAEIILVKVYGEKVLKQRPWIVYNEDKSYLIKGTFHGGPKRKGGVAYIEIRKDNAKIEWYIHTK